MGYRQRSQLSGNLLIEKNKGSGSFMDTHAASPQDFQKSQG
jgi:hypothetical protein